MIWKVLAITRKDIQLYYYKGPVIVFGVLLPLFLFFAFSIGRNLPATFLIPGLVAMTLFFTATSVSPVVMPWETQMRTLERLISCPITMRTLILGDIFASFIFGVCLSAVPVAVGLALGLGVRSPVILLAAILLAAFCFSSLGSLFSSPPTSLVSNIVMLSTFVKFPVIFISGIFIPLEQMPGWGVAVASLSPLTYFTDLARFALQGEAYYPLTIDFAALLCFSALFLMLAVKLHEHALPKRF